MNHLSTIRHDNDAQSVHMMVNELRQEEYDPILCYKPQGTIDPSLCQLPKESFMLAIQTEFQKELYEQYATTIVCIDSTHNTNSHRFKLITVLVPDDYGEGEAIDMHCIMYTCSIIIMCTCTVTVHVYLQSCIDIIITDHLFH